MTSSSSSSSSSTTDHQQYPQMSASARLLLTKELSLAKRNPAEYSTDFVVHSLRDDKINEWIIFMFGPPDSPYAGGVFKILMRFPDNFPLSPPSVQFIGPMFHPNVFRDGKMCISALQHAPPDVQHAEGYWSPALGISGSLHSVVSLLAEPNPNDPANMDCASMFIHNQQNFCTTVKALCEKTKLECPPGISRPILNSPQVAYTMPSLKRTRSDDDDDEYLYSEDRYAEFEE